MGRIYIILGEPKQIDRLENESELYPTQVWFYDGLEEYGLPSAFYVVFFKKTMLEIIYFTRQLRMALAA